MNIVSLVVFFLTNSMTLKWTNLSVLFFHQSTSFVSAGGMLYLLLYLKTLRWCCSWNVIT